MSSPFDTLFPSRHLPIIVVSGAKQEIKLNFKAKSFQQSRGAGRKKKMELKVIKAAWNWGDSVLKERGLENSEHDFMLFLTQKELFIPNTFNMRGREAKKKESAMKLEG